MFLIGSICTKPGGFPRDFPCPKQVMLFLAAVPKHTLLLLLLLRVTCSPRKRVFLDTERPPHLWELTITQQKLQIETPHVLTEEMTPVMGS